MHGEMYGFGSNSSGQLGTGKQQQDPVSLPQLVPFRAHVSADSHNLPSAIACGHSFTVAVLEGKVYAWGKNDKGQCGADSESPCLLSPFACLLRESVFITGISCGLEHTLAVAGIFYCFMRAMESR